MTNVSLQYPYSPSFHWWCRVLPRPALAFALVILLLAGCSGNGREPDSPPDSFERQFPGGDPAEGNREGFRFLLPAPYRQRGGRETIDGQEIVRFQVGDEHVTVRWVLEVEIGQRVHIDDDLG
jgi:hypothetical protein